MLLFVSYREETNIYKLKSCMCCNFKREWSYGWYDYYTGTGGKRTCSKILAIDQLQAAQHHIDLIQRLKIRSRDHKLILKAWELGSISIWKLRQGTTVDICKNISCRYFRCQLGKWQRPYWKCDKVRNLIMIWEASKYVCVVKFPVKMAPIFARILKFSPHARATTL